ncbi:hypothetical protein CCACVL1_07692 [Corchorus capsularis]|uniref:Uncharacterized protein n=1 Tax=Corchorus capsularis TaxID=210143 RepID=A0A1R3J4D1_COCAP|nr:hypothetical protein CCACVL1_07692 [Corchorus capsularis]
MTSQKAGPTFVTVLVYVCKPDYGMLKGDS